MKLSAPFTSKSFPPRLQAGRFLERRKLLDDLRLRWGSRRILLIQAQAGQGKTTLAAQLLEALGIPSAWYQIGPGDDDPVFFITTLLCAIRTALPNFDSHVLAEMAEKREILPQEAPRYAALLAEDFRKALPPEFCLVLDDVHLLEGSTLSLSFLEAVLKGAPPRMKFILTSRHPPEIDIRPLRKDLLTVANDDLALTPGQVGEFFGTVIGLPLSAAELKDIHKATEGWIAGVLILGNTLQSSPNTDPFAGGTTASSHTRQALFDFFGQELFAGLGSEVRRSLLKLSLLETIPLPLARSVAETTDVQELLLHLERKNFFIRRLDPEGEEFFLHHLFREFLREQAQTNLTPEERKEIYCKAGGWSQEAGRTEEALRYYLEAPLYDDAQELISRLGLDLLASNRLVTLGKTLARIPEDVVMEHPWLSYMTGAVRMETVPVQAEPFLERARELFIREQHPVGELLSTVHLVFFHLTVDARFNEGIPLLFRAEKLYHAIRDDLDDISRIWILQVLATGFVYFEGDISKMEEYTSSSLRMAERHGLDNFIAVARIISCYKGLFLGKWDIYRKQVEASLPAFISPHTSRILRLFLCATRINLLEREGDFENYLQEKSLLTQEIGEELVAQTVIGPWILIWDAEFLISRGEFDQALILIHQGLRAQGGGRTPHLHSILLQHLAYLHALRGARDDATEAAEESLRLRTEAGGEWFRIFNDAVLGGAFALLGMEEKALDLLNRALKRSDRMGEEHLRSTALAHRALMQVRRGADPSHDLRALLHAMRRNGYHNLMGVYSPTVVELLGAAFKLGIEPELAQDLAGKVRGVVLRGEGPPLQQMRIHALGGFRMELAGAVLKGHELSVAQRELLTLLLTRSDLQIRQEEAQCLLWPERSPEKSRSSFDTLLSRLRALMESRFAGHPVKDYLSLNKGILRLNHCRVDVQEFMVLVETGLTHVRRKELWQAGNALRTAFRVWEGSFHPGGEQNLLQFKEDLEQLYIEGAIAWSDTLTLFGRPDEGIQLLQQALKFDRTNDLLVRKIHHLLGRTGRPADAAKTLRKYRKALEREGYTLAEVEEIMDEFWG